MRYCAILLLGGLSLLISRTGLTGEPVSQSVQFAIERQPLKDALRVFAQQAHVQVLRRDEDVSVAGVVTPRVEGALSTEEALKKLLDGTELSYEFVNARTVRIVRPEVEKQAPAGRNERGDREIRVARVDSTDQTSVPVDGSDSAEDKRLDLEEIVVTGSHIRGTNNVVSSTQTFGRDAVNRSGYATVQQFLVKLPQNFGGGISENGANGEASPGGSFNVGSGINLRGLGSNATLVLLNGRRLAPSGFGEFVDVSMIPLTAVERIDVLTDGASAIYGSDAVGGVVNIVLRKDFDAAESTARYATTTQGGAAERQLGQTLGTAWAGGHALLGYEYYQRDPLDARKRSYTADAPTPLLLLPQQDRNSLFLDTAQRICDTTEVFGTGFFSRRTFETSANPFAGSFPLNSFGKTRQRGGTLGVATAVGHGWQIEGAVSYSSTRTRYHNIFLLDPPLPIADNEFKFAETSIDLKADGSVLDLPGGVVRAAIGGQYRRETFDGVSFLVASNRNTNDSRDISAVFGELAVPLVGSANRRTGIERLDLSLAVRHERYDTFAGTTNPKFGLVWEPISLLAVRASYGTSFRAPTFDELNDETSNSAQVEMFPDRRSPTGATAVLDLSGQNSGLRPEKARTWSLGLELNPAHADELTASISYFDIHYRERIGSPIVTDYYSALNDEAFLGSLIQRNPTLAQMQAAAASQPYYFNFDNIPLEDVQAILDLRLNNVGVENMRGVDLRMNRQAHFGPDVLSFQLNTQYLLAHNQRITPAAPSADVLDRIFKPADLRARASVNWSRARWTSEMAINYTDGYQDNRTLQTVPVSSWTTFDLYLQYKVDETAVGSWFSGVSVALSASNLFDRNPPFVLDSVNNVRFDGANANALGRFVALQVNKIWP